MVRGALARTIAGMSRAVSSAGVVATEAAIAAQCARGYPALELFERVAERLRPVVPYTAGCWKPTDPETLLFTGFAIEDPVPGSLRSVCWRFVDNELLEPDFAKFGDLARRRRPVTTLHEATHGEPERSPRYREIHRALGFGAELRAVFRSGEAVWGSVALVRAEGEPDFSREEVAFVARISDHLALGLRLALLHESADAAGAPRPPGTIVLRDDLSLESLTAQAERWLEDFPPDRGTGLELPAVVYAVARRARAVAAGGSDLPPAARVHLRSGRWIVVHAAPPGESASAGGRAAGLPGPAGAGGTAPLQRAP